ncbi:glycosyltransferase family 2 protein [Flavobacterium rhamnosiphilum]|uniref:Glycosyltransferase family 2 protein n=1 Tax=Flavobacterium rhamnosiphilum TaxID=2541724 RepID=A0A4R5FC37_9FLAO|nr:glycosyltransferase family 2 protein [Flavobacterium rhamnosiphilum]TDE46047.1 glycosyltransferase family 2 protein [Flavobacterium rhamnosiphilum]
MVDFKFPKITVLMPVYNCELYIKEAVDSILSQTFDDFEFLIIDDASTDKTVGIIKTYNDSRIKLIEKIVNTGYTNSLNYGLTIAHGEYIARMDGDDISLPTRFEKQVNFLDANTEVVVCGTLYSIIGSGKVVKYPEAHEQIKLGMLKENCIVHPSVMMRKQLLDEFSIIYDITKEPAEDYDMWVQLISLGKFYNIQEALLNYRFHEFQVSVKRTDQQKKVAIDTRLKLLIGRCDGIKLEEEEVLRKILANELLYDFNEIEIFNKAKQKIIKSNALFFFEPNELHKYFFQLEKKIVKNYFLSRKKFTHRVYLDYFKIKENLAYKISVKDEIKLLVKSFIYWKIKEIS